MVEQPMYVDSTCFFYGPPGCEDTSGIYYHDKETGKTYKPLPYRNGIPLCHDPLFEMGALGSTCYDEADPTDPQDYRPIAEECEEVGGYSLSKGSYIENGAIVGSPCDPVGFCSDPNSNDPIVRDHCEDIWTDTDECPQGVDDNGQCIINQCPPGSAPIDWCTHLCDEPEYENDPQCNPGMTPPVFPMEPEPTPGPVLENGVTGDENDSPEPPEPEEEGEDEEVVEGNEGGEESVEEESGGEEEGNVG